MGTFGMAEEKFVREIPSNANDLLLAGKRLELTKKQTIKIKKIFDRAVLELDWIARTAGQDRKRYELKMKSILAKSLRDGLKVLSPEQRKRWQKSQAPDPKEPRMPAKERPAILRFLLFSVNRRLPAIGGGSLRTNSHCSGRDGCVFHGSQGEVIGKVFDEDVLELNFHGRPHVNLHPENSIEDATFGIEINQLSGLVSIDPMPVVIALNDDFVVVPDVGFELLDRHFSHNPGLSFGIDDGFLPGVGQNASPPLFIDHPIEFLGAGYDVALVACGDIEPLGRKHAASVLNSAVGPFTVFDL